MLGIFKFFLKQKDNKLNLIFIISTICLFVYAIFLIIYDIAKINELSQNGAILTNFFVFLNVFCIIFAVFDIALLITILLLNKKQIRSK